MLVLCLSATALLAVRNLPQDARLGKLTRFDYPVATIGGKVLRMSPGAKIYNEQNLIIMPAAMRQQATILYRLDTAGQLSAIWILTPQEASAMARGGAAQPGSAPAGPTGR